MTAAIYSAELRGLLSTPEPEGRLITDFIESKDLLDCLRAGRRCEAEARTVQGRLLSACGGIFSDGSFGPAARYLVCFELEDQTAGNSSEEAQRIIRALETNRWRRSAAARALGISRATLWRRMRELGI